VIIVSETSAEVTPRVRTERSAPVRNRSSATHNHTTRHADARPISVHTEVLAGSKRPCKRVTSEGGGATSRGDSLTGWTARFRGFYLESAPSIWPMYSHHC
jgi:hypothetical protein